ncbi:MAG: phytanoyl-CoA dioxygenase family protein [Myxococcota bacterium]
MHPTQPFIDATATRHEPATLRHLGETHGHILVRATLPEEAIDPVRRHVLRAAHAQGLTISDDVPRLTLDAVRTWRGDTDPRWIALQQAVLATEAAHALPKHPALLTLIEALYGGPATAHCGDICRLGVPAQCAPEHTTPPHQDQYYLQGSEALWTAWTPLLDCPLELGPLAVWSGSNRDGLRAHDSGPPGRRHIEPTDIPWCSEALRAGDVVLFHGMTVHRALPNRTDADLRLSMDMRYAPAPKSDTTAHR